MPTPTLEAAGNGHYYAYWSEGRRSRRKSMGTKDRAVAETRFAQWLLLGGHKADTGEEHTEAVAYTVADCWAVYAKKHLGKPDDQLDDDPNWKNLKPHFAELTVPAVTQAEVDSYVQKRTTGRLGRKVKPQTCRKELSILFASLHFCARKGRENPTPLFSSTIIEKCAFPDEGEPRDRWLRTEEMQRLFAAAAKMRRGKRLSRGERFLWLALETAARKQAILDLTWDRVDFETNTIHYDVPGRKKTKKRRVSVVMSKALRPVMERAWRERESDLVMDNKGAVWATVQLIAMDAGFGDGQPRPKAHEKPKATGISPHVLRHTAATHMARRGVPLWKIAKILGNSLAMVEKVYAKWVPEDAENTVDLISAGALEAAE